MITHISCLVVAIAISGTAFLWLSGVYINDKKSRKEVIFGMLIGGGLPLAIITIIPRYFYNMETPWWSFIIWAACLLLFSIRALKGKQH